jgi:broad specificity phosphatase PhoE
MQHLWLIRHAESLSNAGEPTDAPDTIGLSALGVIQAKKLAEIFPAAPDLIVTTKYDRTGLSAAPLRQRFPDVATEVWPIYEFTYLAPARYSGSTEDQRRPAAQAYWDRNDPDYIDGAGAESFRDFITRIRTLRESARRAGKDFISVFTHGFVIKAIVWDQLREGEAVTAGYMQGFYQLHRSFPVLNGSVTPMLLNGNAAPEIGTPWLYPYDKIGPRSK